MNENEEELTDFALEGETGGEESRKEILELSADMPVQVVVVMGRKGVTVKDLLDLQGGQVVEMDCAPTDPVEIVAAGKVIAKGELVEVDGKLGVRILQLLK